MPRRNGSRSSGHPKPAPICAPLKKLKPPFTGFRLRCGDYRVFFEPKDETTIEVTGVRNRREAYR
jgi:mRNA-degrading endonuclease RelE of RelBE toxin-antitoxin system